MGASGADAHSDEQKRKEAIEMSDRTLQDASDTEFPEDEFFEDIYADEEPALTVVAAPAPRPVRHVDGIDALAEPAAMPFAAGPARADQPGLRERIRSSRYGTLVVLLVTAALVAGGMWLVDGRKQGGETLANGATAVTVPGRSTAPAPKVGEPAQDFTVTTIDGEKVSLSQFKGQPVWLVFGASWCAPCQAEVPDIEAAHKEYGPKGLVILGVNITEDTETVKAYAQRVGITSLLAADPESAIADVYRVSAIPAHYFIDKSGVVKEIRQGSVSPDSIATSMKGLVTP
jgi:peroxiredoxin